MFLTFARRVLLVLKTTGQIVLSTWLQRVLECSGQSLRILGISSKKCPDQVNNCTQVHLVHGSRMSIWCTQKCFTFQNAL